MRDMISFFAGNDCRMKVKSGRCYAVSVIISLIFHISFFIFASLPSYAQYNIDRLINVGRSALYYEDYVLSMQYFNQATLIHF